MLYGLFFPAIKRTCFVIILTINYLLLDHVLYSSRKSSYVGWYCKGFPGELPVTESLWVVEPALEGIPLFKTLLQQSYELGVAEQAPWSGVDEAGRYFSGEAFDVQVRAESLQQAGHEIQVSVQGK